LHLALGCSAFTPFNDLLGLIQHLTYGGRIQRTELTADPVFVLGHWRSGTTLMHELLVLDEQFASPSTYACFAPWHFLVSESLMVKYGSWLVPDKRPMDNMRAGWQRPLEDEFALMNLGAPTPYLLIAFPKSDPPWGNFIDMRGVDAKDLAKWRKCFMWFIKALTLKHKKQLVLKSPPHTGRVEELLKMFPRAKFIHMVRDPRKLFPSTLKLWLSLADIQGMQDPEDNAKLRAYIWDCLQRMYASFEAARQLVPKDNLIDVRYEDLIANPDETMAHVYGQLGLGDYSVVRPLIAERFANDREYKVNEHRIDPDLDAAVLAHWGDYARRYGYA
jgi:omega-hydroxy-beta-dihydromenaquinone-9 sulfotransferase